MGKYILIWLWGAVTSAFWFLAFIKFSDDTAVPNSFIVFAIVSTIMSVVFAVMNEFLE